MDNDYSEITIDLNSSLDLATSEDQLGNFLSSALMYLQENVQNKNGRQLHPKVSSHLYSNDFEFNVTCFHAEGFYDPRTPLDYQEDDYIGSLQNCKMW